MISLVLGLGNIGRRYDGTRHNVGFEVISLVGRLLDAESSRKREYFRFVTARLASGLVRLARPVTLMNRSGLAAEALLDEFGLEPVDMLVVVDDYHLQLGRLRIRPDGGDGGHNGLASIINRLGTEGFPRLRLGTGPLPEGKDPAEFVLERFTMRERREADKVVERAAKAVLFATEHPLERVMSQYNINPAPPDHS